MEVKVIAAHRVGSSLLLWSAAPISLPVSPMVLSSSSKQSLANVCTSHLLSGAWDLVGHDISIPPALSKMETQGFQKLA